MAISMAQEGEEQNLNTVAVIPLSFDSSSSSGSVSRSRSNLNHANNASASPATQRADQALKTAAANLIYAIAQGSFPSSNLDHHQQCLDNNEEDDGDGEDEGSSSFVYIAPPDSGQASGFGSSSRPTVYASTPWRISNRYYDADVVVKAYDPEIVFGGHDAPRSSTAAATAAGDGVEFSHQPTNDLESESDWTQTHPRCHPLFDHVPAYVLVVDQTRPLEDHRRAVKDIIDHNLVSGFDAEISIVAGISSISANGAGQVVTNLEDDRTQTSSSSHSRSSRDKAAPSIPDLIALYADAGWEFISIDDEAQQYDYDDEGRDEDDEDFGAAMEQDGIERIREALMNHMWNGLRRKDDRPSGITLTLNHPSTEDADDLFAATGPGFSDMRSHIEADEDGEEEAQVVASSSGTNRNGSTLSERQNNNGLSAHTRTGNLLQDLLNGTAVPQLPKRLDTQHHATPDELDSKLAQMFLSSSSANHAKDLADLEAFLQSEDPTWPSEGPAEITTDFPTASETPTNTTSVQDSSTERNASVHKDADAGFEDDFDEFLPFQSAPAPAPAPFASGLESTAATDDHEDDLDPFDLPPASEIARMRDQLFGRNQVQDRLQDQDQDFGAQLQQLQYHAQRVRNISDPDQRRSQAALVALAFSLQWGTENEPDPNKLGADQEAIRF